MQLQKSELEEFLLDLRHSLLSVRHLCAITLFILSCLVVYDTTTGIKLAIFSKEKVKLMEENARFVLLFISILFEDTH